MAQAHLHESRETRKGSTGDAAAEEREGGLVLTLWLVVVLMAEVELLMWLLQRAYGQ
jgi:hypothetical protein